MTSNQINVSFVCKSIVTSYMCVCVCWCVCVWLKFKPWFSMHWSPSLKCLFPVLNVFNSNTRGVRLQHKTLSSALWYCIQKCVAKTILLLSLNCLCCTCVHVFGSGFRHPQKDQIVGKRFLQNLHFNYIGMDLKKVQKQGRDEISKKTTLQCNDGRRLPLHVLCNFLQM